MGDRTYFSFKPQKETLVTVTALVIAILVVYSANLFKERLFFLFYNCIFGLGICTFFPLLYTKIFLKEPLKNLGLTTKNWLNALIVALPFLLVSIPGQFIKKVFSFPPFGKLICITIALIMSALFEELFFRGFLQTRFEKAFGIIPAIILSGAAFSLYHLGYPNYRNMELLVLMFWVGSFFAISFSITKNVITSFIVNLLNAIISCVLKSDLFQEFNPKIAVISFFTVLTSICIITFFKIKENL